MESEQVCLDHRNSSAIIDRKDLLRTLLLEIKTSRKKAEYRVKFVRRMAYVSRGVISFLHVATLVILTLVLSGDDSLASSILGLLTHSFAFGFQMVSNFSDLEALVAERVHTMIKFREIDRDLSLTLSRNHLTTEQIEIIYESAINELALIEAK